MVLSSLSSFFKLTRITPFIPSMMASESVSKVLDTSGTLVALEEDVDISSFSGKSVDTHIHFVL